MKRLAIWLGISLLCASSVARAQQQTTSSTSAPETTENQIVATAKGCTVTLPEINEVISDSPKNFATLEKRKQLAESLLLRKIIILAAEREGFDRDPEIQREIQMARDRGLASVYYSQHIHPLHSEERAHRYYNAHVDEFAAPAQIRVKHMVVRTQEEAQAIKADLDRGESFEKLANQRSIDQRTASKGGDLGWVRPGLMGAEFDRVAFDLEPGQISPVLPSPAGYQIVKVEEKVPSKGRDWQEVKARVIEQLRAEALKEAKQRLMRKWKPTFYEEVLAKAADSLAHKEIQPNDEDHSQILAQAGDQVITVAEYNHLLQQYPPQTIATPEQKRDLLENLFLSKLFVLEAQGEGLDQRPETQKRFQAAREKVLIDSYYYKHALPLASEPRLREYYNAHVKGFVKVPKVRARHILVGTEQEARSIKAELGKGANFEELARRKSIDQITASVGGYLGWKEAGSLPPEFEQAAFGLNPGQMSDVVKTASGYHIILLEEKIPSFEQARSAIFQKLAAQAIETVNKRLLKEWEASINEDRLKF